MNKLLKNLFIGLVFIFLYLPIVVLVIFSFNSSEMNIIFENFTFDWYKNLFQNTNLIDAFINTLVVAGISTTVSVVVGTISAICLYKYDFPFKKLINKLIYIPIVIPEIVLGISLLSIYTLTKLDLGLFTIILSHIAFSIPYVIVSVISTFSNNVLTYEEASKDLGVNSFKTFIYVTLPLIKSGVISGGLLSFTLSLDDVVISYFTAGPSSNTLPLYVYSIIKTGITPDVNALSSLMLLIVIIIISLLVLIQSKKIKGEVK